MPIMPPPLARLLSVLMLAIPLALAGGPAFAQSSAQTGAESSGENAQASTKGALESLIGILQDEAARAALISELESAVQAAGEGTSAQTEPSADEPSVERELRLVGGQVADASQALAARTVAAFGRFWNQLAATPATFSALSLSDWSRIGKVAGDLLALVLITYGALIVSRMLNAPVRDRLRAGLAREGVIARTLGIGIGLVLDLTTALIPWAIGYGVALAILPPSWTVSFAHSLYLNAFIVIEVALVFLRVVVSPRRPDLRLIGITDASAKIAMGWGRVFVSLFVYGQLVLLPLVNRLVAPQAGRALSIIVLLAILALIAGLVMGIQRPVALKMARRWRIHNKGRGAHLLVRFCAVPVYIYLAILALIAVALPIDEFYRVLMANAQVAVAVVAGMIAYNLITKMIGGGIHLPPQISQRVPLLEVRLNAFVPRLLYLLRLAVVAAVIVFCLQALGVFDVLAFLESQFGTQLAGMLVTVFVILLVAFVLWLVLNAWVDYRINPDYAVGVSARERTLLVLMRNALSITLMVIVLMVVLAELGLDIAPLLASAGVIGLAIGFGAQKLVQDIITGVFIQLEGAIDVGDVVSIGGVSGVVERLTVRSAGLRDLEGSYHVIPFSSVDVVTNFMRGFSYALLDIGVAYRESTEEAKQAIFDAFAELRVDPEHGPAIIDELEWLGLNEFGASEIVLRARIKTLPGKQWGVKRAYNAILKRIFDERNIEIPFPHQTVYFGADKAGNAPPLHLVRDDVSKEAPAPSPESAEEPTQDQSPARKRKRRPKPAKTVDLPDVDEGPESEQ